MSKKQLTTGIAVVAALAVVAIFFFYQNPFALPSQSASPSAQAMPTSSNLVVQDEVVGTGAEATQGAMVTIDYTGKLENGTIFDTSIGKAPYQFTLGTTQVIPGFAQGILGMKVGGKRLLIIPPNLAYGAQAVGPIPANSTLVFEVSLLKVATPNAAAPIPEGANAQ